MKPKNCCHEQQKTNKEGPSQVLITDFTMIPKHFMLDKSIFEKCQILDVVEKSYIIVQHQNNVYCVDQHAACEKYIFMDEIANQTERECRRVVNSLHFLVPNIFLYTLRQKQQILYSFGWRYKILERKGSYTDVEILNQPYLHRVALVEEDFMYHLQKVYQNQNVTDLKQLKEKVGLSQNEMEIIAQYACKKAYKFGDQLTQTQTVALVRNLARINGPFNCPHSRPLVGYYGKNEE